MNKLTDFITKAFVEIREETVEEIPDTGKLLEIGTGDILPNPSQPRRHFSPEELTSLAKSITANGIIQPLTVRQTENGFELISGERRLRAAKLAGLKTVPCILIEADKKRSAVLALLENIQRSDLNCFEEAAAINKLIESGEITREKISIKLGMARSTIANKLRLLKLTDEEQQLMIEKGLTERHARALLRVADEDRRKERPYPDYPGRRIPQGRRGPHSGRDVPMREP